MLIVPELHRVCRRFSRPILCRTVLLRHRAIWYLNKRHIETKESGDYQQAAVKSGDQLLYFLEV